MNFFEHQEQAQKTSRRLVAFFILAVIAIVISVNLVVFFLSYTFFQNENLQGIVQEGGNFFSLLQAGWETNLFLFTSIITLGVIAVASSFKWTSFREGGSAVAESMGGQKVHPSTRNAQERQLLNIIEEMAIASGVPVPDVYIMPEESINAFAAGHNIHNAAIGVTKGLLDQLDRDELQGVIAHEFSHIFHGDMKLNMKLIALLFGIVAIAMIGKLFLRMGLYSSYGYRSRRNNGGIAFAIGGLCILVVGGIGIFFARLIQSAVSRQREFLADASAVQYTRDPDGISGALKKIAVFSQGSKLQNVEAQENSHMMFSAGINSLFATHPPLPDRIRAIDPQFDGDFSKVKTRKAKTKLAEEAQPPKKTRLQDLFGNPQKASLFAAGAALQSWEEDLQTAAHDPYSSRALVMALLLQKNESSILRKQRQFLSEKEGESFLKACLKLREQIEQKPAQNWLSFLQMALPALRELSPEQREDFSRSVHVLVEADSRLSIFEFCVALILRQELFQLEKIRSKNPVQSVSRILSALSYAGFRSGQDPKEAFRAGVAIMKNNNLQLLPSEECGLQKLERSFREAAHFSPKYRKQLINAVVAAIQSDDQILPREYNLLQTLGICLEVPLPAMT